MDLLPNSPIKMDYSPVTDILAVEYPSLDSAHLPIVTESLLVMVKAINEYDIKRLLLDASATQVSVSEEENKGLSMRLATALLKTRIEKLARVQPVDLERENVAQANIAKMREAGIITYQLQTFNSKDEAIAWLKN
jgi:hypothetical protein